MKHLSRLLMGSLVCFGLLNSAVLAESDRAFMSKTIKDTLRNWSRSHAAKFRRRTVTLETLEDSRAELRVALWTLVGEPVHTYEFRMPQLRKLIFEADDGYTNSVRIVSVGDNDIYFDGYTTVFVGQDVLDKIKYVDFSFSLSIAHLKPLPRKYYSVDEYTYYSSTFQRTLIPYIHMNNPGILSSPGKWGWDTPGSPQWNEFLSDSHHSLKEGETRLPKRYYLDEQEAKEAFRRMLWAYHKDRDIFHLRHDTGHFQIYHLRVNPDRILNQIFKHSPEAYAKIMERE